MTADLLGKRTHLTLAVSVTLIALAVLGGGYLKAALALSAIFLAVLMVWRPARTLPWRLATVGACLWALEEIVWAVQRFGGPNLPALTDVTYYLGLAAWLAALLLMPGKRLPPSLLLAAVPAVGLLLWLLLLDPPSSLSLGFPVFETLLVLASLPLLGGTMMGGASEGRVLVGLSFYLRALGAGSFAWLAGPTSEVGAQFLWLLSYTMLALGAQLELDDEHTDYLPIAVAITSLQLVSAALLLVLFRLGMLEEPYALVIVSLLTYVQLAVVLLVLVTSRINQVAAERELRAWARLLDPVMDAQPHGAALERILDETVQLVPGAQGIELHDHGVAGALTGYPYPLVAGGAEIGRLYLTRRPHRSSVLDTCAPMLASRLLLLGDRDRWAAAALTDPLTGLLNRRGLEARAGLLVGQAKADVRPISVAMLDLDHFKRVNDVYGHGVGDDVLKVLAGVLRAQLRPSDQAVRWGGEEFVVVLPGADADQAVEVLKRVRHELGVALVKPVAWPLAVSVGIAGSVGPPRSEEELGRLVEEADGALVAAKREGRNRIVLSGTL